MSGLWLSECVCRLSGRHRWLATPALAIKGIQSQKIGGQSDEKAARLIGSQHKISRPTPTRQMPS
jgi:hypothetical protein